jgi:threonylcarbamoyladenosine tRNA methylthiotransferase MtaB
VQLIKKHLSIADMDKSGKNDSGRGLREDKFLNSSRMMVKIQDGCNRFCSYCIVPYLRGLPKSRLTSDIVSQVKANENYMKEIVLTAINTHAYGIDTKESLIDLIRSVMDETTIQRISFGSVHPWSLDQAFLDYYKTIAQNERFSSFFHVPIQSCSDNILRLMKRDYTREEIGEKLETIARIYPKALIATDIIVGYLEETDKDFGEALDFLNKIPVSKFHIFRFSKRNNTAAFYQAKKMTEPTVLQKKQRAKALLELYRRKYAKFLHSLLGYRSTALFIGQEEGGFQKAILNNQVTAMIPVNKNLSGCMKHVTITELKKDCPIGNLD